MFLNKFEQERKINSANKRFPMCVKPFETIVNLISISKERLHINDNNKAKLEF